MGSSNDHTLRNRVEESGSSIGRTFRNTVIDRQVCLLSIASHFRSGHCVFFQSHIEPAFYAVTQDFSAIDLY